MNTGGFDLRTLLHGEDTNRRAVAADNLERQTQDAASALSALLSAYLAAAYQAAGNSGPLRDAFRAPLVRRASMAIYDLACLAETFGQARVSLNEAVDKAAAKAAGS